MRVLVTGAAGFVGSHLSEQLLAEGHTVAGLDAFIDYYPRTVKERNLAALRSHPEFTLHELDLRSADLAPALEDADAVIHEAAMPGLTRSWTEFDAYMTCNLLGTQRLVEAALATRVKKFVHISTSSVYGGDAVGDETMPLHPVSPYGVTKLAAEQLVLAYLRARGLPATILRYFSIYGPRQRPDMAYNIFIQRMQAGQSITVYGDGSQSRSNTYVSDCVRGTIQALSDAAVGEVYNVGGGTVITLNNAITIIADALGVTPRIEYAPGRLGDQRHTAADTTKARTTFGYEPCIAPDEGLRAQVEWQRSTE